MCTRAAPSIILISTFGMDSGCDTNGSKHSNQSDSLVWWIIPFYAKDWGQAWFSWAKKASRSFSRDWQDIYIRENSWTSFWRLETLEVVFDFFVETEFGCSYVICLWIQLQCYWCGLQHISDTNTFSPCLLQTSQLLPLSRTLFVWFQVSTVRSAPVSANGFPSSSITSVTF